ncbi:MAG: epsilon-lactone hydrolase, partial [Solirubrobacterales bacterium]|nr:epsilon-lactone hydrolase [Solirubrobacterales bacterium]
MEPGTLGGVGGEWVTAAGSSRDGVLLYLHGGGYAIGSPQGYRAVVGRLVSGLGVPAFVPDYRLAPEHPHPAAADDAIAVY